MDSNLMSCPTCGHSVSNSAGACAYCGAMMTENQQPPTAEKGTAGKAQSVESPGASTQPASAAPADVSDPADETPAWADDPSDPPGSQEHTDLSPEETPFEARPATGSEEKQGSTELEAQSTSIEAEPQLKAEAESEPLPPGAQSESNIPSTEDRDPETVAGTKKVSLDKAESDKAVVEPEPTAANSEPPEPVASPTPTDASAEESALTPETDMMDAAVDEPGESGILGENIIELAEVNELRKEPGKAATPEKSPPLGASAEPGDSDSPEVSRPKSDAGIPIDAKAGLITESLGDTILLDMADEVRPDAAKVPDKVQPSAKSSSAAEAAKVEKTAEKMTAANNKQKASLAEAQKKKQEEKAQALKQQEAALAKARAVKKQKMILAKTAALKRKKAAQAKAMALKNQEIAPTGIENSKKNGVTGVNTAAAEITQQAREPHTGSKLNKLLERYKGQAIGINYDNSADIREARLVEANNEYFSVFVKEKNLRFSYPLKTILTLIESKDGVEASDSGKKRKYTAVIKVYPLVLF